MRSCQPLHRQGGEPRTDVADAFDRRDDPRRMARRPQLNRPIAPSDVDVVRRQP